IRCCGAKGCGRCTISAAGKQKGRDKPGLRCFVQRSEEHTSELQSLMRISYAVFCLKKKTISDSMNDKNGNNTHNHILLVPNSPKINTIIALERTTTLRH